jgi:hypothetical protein
MKSVEQFLLFMANSPFNHLEIREISNWLDGNGGAVLEESIQNLRRTAQQTLLRTRVNMQRSNSDEDFSIEDFDLPPLSDADDPAVEIETLLRIDGGLKTTEASELLLREIYEQLGRSLVLPKLGKNAFRLWLDRLAKKVSYPLLVECATRIKDEIAESSPTPPSPEEPSENKEA